jgi:hypothetical protein
MRLATDRIRTDIKPALFSHLPKIGSHRTSSSNEPVKARPSWIRGARRFRRFRHCCQSGLASGVSSLCRLGFTVAGFLHVRHPGSLGLHPPWGIPLPSLGLTTAATAFATANSPAPNLCTCYQLQRPICARPPLGTSGSTRSGSCSLCFRVSKSPGSWLCLFRGRRPLRFSSSSLPCQ